MWIKICGISDPETAGAVAACQPDAIGLNFHPPSPRCVDPHAAQTIVAELPPGVEPIGVFVNRSRQEILQIAQQVGLQTVQLHGDEPASLCRDLQAANLDVIRAFRVGDEGLAEVAEYLSELKTLRVELRACLIDARVAGAYGGTGHTAPWELLSRDWQCDWPPLILAGGLTPDNVRSAIKVTGCWGIDTASGVESSPGKQNLEKVREFIRQGRLG